MRLKMFNTLSIVFTLVIVGFYISKLISKYAEYKPRYKNGDCIIFFDEFKSKIIKVYPKQGKYLTVSVHREGNKVFIHSPEESEIEQVDTREYIYQIDKKECDLEGGVFPSSSFGEKFIRIRNRLDKKEEEINNENS